MLLDFTSRNEFDYSVCREFARDLLGTNVSRFQLKILSSLCTPPLVSWLPFILLLSLPEREIVLIIAFSNDRCEALGRCFLFRLLRRFRRPIIGFFISLRGTFAFIGFYFDLFLRSRAVRSICTLLYYQLVKPVYAKLFMTVKIGCL